MAQRWDYHCPEPPAKKGTQAYLKWAKEVAFPIHIRHVQSLSEASRRCGYHDNWFNKEAMRDPEWAEGIRQMRAVTDDAWTYPDISDWSFEYFVQQYFGIDLVDHQREIAAALEDPKGKLVLVLGFPESGKSTLCSLWYPLYRMAQNPDIRIALVSKSGHMANKLLHRLKRYLTEGHLYDDTPRDLIKDFGGWRPLSLDVPWSADQIFVRHRRSGERDPTVQALGIGKQIYGARLDLLILDDSLILDNQKTDHLRESIDTWFTQEARSRAQRGQTLVNGTRIFPHDLYGQWKKSWKQHPLFRLVVVPAILAEGTDNERVTWPEYWTLDGYDEVDEDTGDVVGYREGMRDIRSFLQGRPGSRWELVYQQEDVEDIDNIFTETHIEEAFSRGKHRTVGQVYPHEILVHVADPATTGRAASLVLALDPETRVRTVVDLFVGERLGATGIRQRLFYAQWDRYRDHGITESIIDTLGAPTMLGDEDFTKRAEASGIQLQGFITKGRGARAGTFGGKFDPEYGVATLADLFGSGLIAFPSASAVDRQAMAPLVDDLLGFPWVEQQDCVMCLWMGVTGMAFYHRRQFDQEQIRKQRGVPPIASRRVSRR